MDLRNKNSIFTEEIFDIREWFLDFKYEDPLFFLEEIKIVYRLIDSFFTDLELTFSKESFQECFVVFL